jgi:hypothetical protein
MMAKNIIIRKGLEIGRALWQGFLQHNKEKSAAIKLLEFSNQQSFKLSRSYLT